MKSQKRMNLRLISVNCVPIRVVGDSNLKSELDRFRLHRVRKKFYECDTSSTIFTFILLQLPKIKAYYFQLSLSNLSRIIFFAVLFRFSYKQSRVCVFAWIFSSWQSMSSKKSSHLESSGFFNWTKKFLRWKKIFLPCTGTGASLESSQPIFWWCTQDVPSQSSCKIAHKFFRHWWSNCHFRQFALL